MKKISVLHVITLVSALTLFASIATASVSVLPSRSIWEYTFTNPTQDPLWNTSTGTGGDWLTGRAPFGNTVDDVDFNDGSGTLWATGSHVDGDDLWVRCAVHLDGYDLSSARWFIGVDNGYKLYVNGTLISEGWDHGYTFKWEYSGSFGEYLTSGVNIIALALDDKGFMTAFDMEITADALPTPTPTPTPPPETPADSDADGVTNYREVKDGTDPNDPNSFNPLSKGLVAYFPLDGSVVDESGNSVSSTNLGGSAAEGVQGMPNTAIKYGGGQRSSIDLDYKNTDAMSVSVWLRTLRDHHSYPVFNDGWFAGFGIGWTTAYVDVGGPGFFAGIGGFDGWQFVSDFVAGQPRPLVTPFGEWVHIVGTVGSDRTLRYYINGKLYASGVMTARIAWTPGIPTVLSFGQSSDTDPSEIGRADQLRIYNRALSENEIHRLYFSEGFSDAQKHFVLTTPSVTGHYSQAEYNANRTNGQTDVTTNPSAFNLFTQEERETFGALQFSNGQASVTNNPSAFGLFTQSQYDADRTNGINDVFGVVPSVDIALPQSTALRLTLGGSNVTSVVLDDTQSPLPDTWSLDEQQGQLVGTISGTNTISFVLEGEMADGAPAIRIPFNFYPQSGQTIAAFGRMPTQTFSYTPLTVALPTSSSELPVVLSVKSGPATITSSNKITFTGVGRVVLAANQAGTTNFSAAREVTTSFVVNKGSQTINFPALNSVPFVGGNTIQIAATASSDLPVTFRSSNTRVLTISGSTATIVGRGKATITATQAGDARWNAARAVAQTITIF